MGYVRKKVRSCGKYITIEHVRLGWVFGIEYLPGNLYLSFGRYTVIIHKEH